MNDAQAIVAKIDALDAGALFVASDFYDITRVSNVNNVLSRMANAGKIARVVRGIYVKPKFSEFLQEYLIPDPDAVAHAIARNNKWIIAPAGDVALNRLGLDTQVPAVYQYVSSGPYKKYNYGKFTLEMLHRANRDMLDYSPTTMTVIQALKALGKDKIDADTLARVEHKLSVDQIEVLYDETKNATSWIFDFAKMLKEKNSNA